MSRENEKNFESIAIRPAVVILEHGKHLKATHENKENILNSSQETVIELAFYKTLCVNSYREINYFEMSPSTNDKAL